MFPLFMQNEGEPHQNSAQIRSEAYSSECLDQRTRNGLDICVTLRNVLHKEIQQRPYPLPMEPSGPKKDQSDGGGGVRGVPPRASDNHWTA
jgi:hypothetical protein